MRIALIALIALVLLGEAIAETQPPRRVIWIAIDSLRQDRLSFAGYDRNTSPWIDGLIPSSAVFTSAFSPANSTGFSVAATMAGRHYSLIDHDSHPVRISPNVKTLPSVFQESGTRTFGWIANVVLVKHGSSGFARGFDEWHKIIPKSYPKATLDEIIEYVETNYEPTGGAEFHYIHTMDVHEPYVPPIPFDRLWSEYTNTGAVRFGTMPQADGRVVLSDLPYHSEGHSVRDTDIAYLETQYDGTIRFTDERLPALLQALEYDHDEDVLILSSDHGEQLFEHHFWGHGKSLYPEEINVPLIIRGPGITPSIHAGPVSLIDLFPTLCDLFVLEKPDGLLGVSLLPAIQGNEPVPLHTVYSEMPYWTGGVFSPQAVVIHGTDLYKFAANIHWLRPWAIWPTSEELYRLDVDPRCVTNVAEARRERANELNGALREINPRYAPYTPEAIRGNGSDAELGPELMPKLSVESSKSMRIQRSSIRAGENAGLTLVVPESNLDVFAFTSPGLTYMLEIEYILDSGAFHLSMKDDNSSKPFWEYPIRKSSLEAKTIRAMVSPTGRVSRLELKTLESGKFRFHNVSLRAVAVPKFRMIQWQRAGMENSPESEVDIEEVETALEALGYVD